MAAVGLKTVMRRWLSTQMMASMEVLITASRRRSLACSWVLRSCRVWRSASSGPWSTTAHMNWADAGPVRWGISMQAMCRSPCMAWPWDTENCTSCTSLRPCWRASKKAWATRSASSGTTKGMKEASSRSWLGDWKALCAMALAWMTMSCSSITSSGSGTLENSASKRSDALSATAWL